MSNVARPEMVFTEITPQERDFIQQQSVAETCDCRFYEQPAEDLPDDEKASMQHLSCFIRSQIDAAFLSQCPKLRFIATRSTGFDHIDLEACKARGITVSNVPHYGENTVAEHTFGLILALSRHIYQAVDRVKRGDLSIEGLLGFDLYGKTLGVVGAGKIGLRVIRIGAAMSMRVLAFDAKPQPLLAEVLGFDYVSLPELLGAADVVSLHAPLLPSTHHLLDAEKLSLMRPSAILVNTSRGPIVDSRALLVALNEGRLAGAALDVLEGEDIITEDHVLLHDESTSLDQLRLAVEAYQLMHHPRCLVTGHLAFYSREALQRILLTTIENIHACLAGHAQNQVA